MEVVYREEIKEIIKDWMLTGPLDDSPSDEDYDNVAKDIMEALNGE